MRNNLECQPGRVKSAPAASQAKQFRIACVATMMLAFLADLNALWANRVDVHGGVDALVADFVMIVVSIGAAVAMFIVWVVRLTKFQDSWKGQLTLTISVFGPIALVVLSCVLIAEGVPFRFAFACSRPAMERAIAEVRADPTKSKLHRMVGLMPVDSIAVQGAGASVSIEGANGFDTEPYLQWSPGGAAPVGNFYGVKPLGNDWYWVNQ